MKVHVQLEIERAEELIVLGKMFASFGAGDGGTVEGDAPIPQPAPVEPQRVSRQKAVAAPPPADDKPAEKPAEKPAVMQDEGVEEITKAFVADELKAFITAHGSDGPKLALRTLKGFDAKRFDDLQPENYSKFLSALKAA